MSLFEDQTYENLLANAMARVSSAFDKREGSMVYNGVAPSMAELAQLYIGLDFVFTATYIATAPRDYLIERAKDRGLSPKAASAAVFRAEFNIEVPVGSRFSCEELNFIVMERMTGEDTETGLSHKVTCETAGSAANDCTGDLIPIEYIDGLTSAKLVELLIPGDDEEETETFRQRVLDSVKNQAFGGNKADYKAKVLSIDGVSAVKVHPVWNADISPSELIPSEAVKTWYESFINTVTDKDAKAWLTSVYTSALDKKLTVGGCVKLVIMGADNSVPSSELISAVQTVIDPVQNAGEGRGLAPIGHVVNVVGVSPYEISVSAKFTLNLGYTFEDAEDSVNNVVQEYFNEIASNWGNESELTVRISEIENRILYSCKPFIYDIENIKLNGYTKNIKLEDDYIPVLASGGVTNV
jgi:uncharacterized phage protein gp47/JayE